MSKLKCIVFIIIIIIVSNNYCAEIDKNNRTFIREYTYNASENDSKISSRSKALDEVKILLLQEIGVYIESWVNIKNEEINLKTNEFFKQEIKTLTAGITETKILEEKWDGSTYYIKASITIDTNDVIKKINYALENNLKNKEIDRLKNLLSTQQIEKEQNTKEIEQLKGQLTIKQSQNEESEKQLILLRSKLTELQNKYKYIQEETDRVRSQTDQIMENINRKTQTAKTNIRLYMTKNEVLKIAGEPRSRSGYDDIFWNYGKIWVYFGEGIVKSVFYDYKSFKASYVYLPSYRDEFINKNIAD